MKVLFIGGSGIISSACTALAVDAGIDLYLLNRGRTDFRPIPAAAHVLPADLREPASAAAALAGHTFDAVVDWIAFTPDQVRIADPDVRRPRELCQQEPRRRERQAA